MFPFQLSPLHSDPVAVFIVVLGHLDSAASMDMLVLMLRLVVMCMLMLILVVMGMLFGILKSMTMVMCMLRGMARFMGLVVCMIMLMVVATVFPMTMIMIMLMLMALEKTSGTDIASTQVCHDCSSGGVYDTDFIGLIIW